MQLISRSFARVRKTWLLVLALVLCALLLWLFANKGGANGSILPQAILTGLLLGGIYSLVSMGLTLVFGVLDIINFAHGTFMTLAMYCAFVLVSGAAVNPYLTLLAVVPLLFVFGFLLQRFLINRVMGQPIENQLLLTFGVSLLVGNALLLIFSGTPKVINAPFGQINMHIAGLLVKDGVVHIFGAVADLPRLLAFFASLLLAGVLVFLLRSTTLGTAVRAVAENPQGAALVGINVQIIYAITFGLGTACVGAAGTLMLPFLPLDPTIGEQFTIIAFIVVALGGLGNIGGAFLGGLLIGVIQELSSVLLPSTNNLLIVFALFIVILLLRPQGLLGERKA